MRKQRRIVLVPVIVLLALLLASCSGSTPEPSGGKVPEDQKPGPGPGTGTGTDIGGPELPADGVFTISQDRFTAEKAALAMYNAVSAKMSQMQRSRAAGDGETSISFETDEGSIGAGSKLTMVPNADSRLIIDGFVVYKEEGAEVSYVVLEGTVSDKSFSDLDVSLFALADEDGNPLAGSSWSDMPTVFFIYNKGKLIEEMIKAFVSSSGAGETTSLGIDPSQSFYNPMDGKGWIVYTEPSSSTIHKVNFNSNDSTSYTVDGWCEVVKGNDMTVSQTPAIREEGEAMLSDEEALRLGTEAYAYCLYLSMFTKWENKPEWIQVNTGSEGNTIIIKEHEEASFFSEPATVKGEIRVGSSASRFTLEIGGTKVEVMPVGDGSGSALGGEIATFTVDQKDYSHLRDELYLACLRVFTSTYNIISLFDAIADESDISHWWQNVTVDGSKYTFNNAEPAEWMSEHAQTKTVINGKMEISSGGFKLELTFTEKSMADEELSKVKVSASGTVLAQTSRPQFERLEYPTFDLECCGYELRIVNFIAREASRLVSSDPGVPDQT